MGSMGEVVAKFGADISGFASGLARMAGLASGAGGLIAGALIGAGVAIVGIGVASTMMAGTFQQGMTRLVTGAGDVTDNMKKMGQSILGISVATGQMSGPLINAMYLIISSGQRGAQALNTLGVAAKGAVIEQANVVDVANALSGAMTNYGTKQFNATQYMNGFIVATQRGKLTLEQMSLSMGPLEPIAASLGIRFSDLAGAMSTMTSANIPAERAATSMRFLMQSLENPTHKAKVAMEEYGLSSVAVGNELKVSLPGALEMIYNAAKRAGPEGSVPFNRALADMTGGQRSLSAMLALTGTHLKDFINNTTAVEAAMRKSHTAVLGWDEAQKNFNVQLDRGKAAIAAAGIAIGTQLLPVLTQIASKIVPVVVAFADWIVKSHAVENTLRALKPVADLVFSGIMMVMPQVTQLWAAFVDVIQRTSKWVAQNKDMMDALKVTLIGIGVVIGAVVLAAVIALVGILAGLAAIIVVVILVVKAVMDVMKAWAAIAPTLGAAWNTAITYIISLWTNLETAAVDVWNRTGAAISAAVSAVVQFVVDRWNTLSTAAVDVWNRMGAGIQAAFNATVSFVEGLVTGFVSAVIGFFQGLYHSLVGGSIIPDMCTAIIAVFATLAGRVTGPINNAVHTIINILQGAIGLAMNAGANIVKGIANGITGAIGFVAGAISNVVGFIAAHLPHSPAKVGPLSKLDEFGPALTHGFAAGIVRGTPEVTAAVNKMVGTPPGGTLAGTGAVGTRSGPVTIIVQFGPTEVARQLLPYLAKETILQIGGAH